MTEKTIQAVPILPFALMLACIGAVIGLILGALYAVSFNAILSLMPSTTEPTVNLDLLRLLFGVGALVLMPVLGFASGLLQGALCAALYNFLAPRIGGIRLRFKEDTPVSPPPS
jgi:hypothetical protein